MATGRANAAAERAAVQRRVIWFDRRMGLILGTDKRVPKADFRANDDKHNYDCWDTTRNVTSLMLVMQMWNLVQVPRHAIPITAASRSARRRHNTAVLALERATKVEWAVDLLRGYRSRPMS